MLPLTPQEVASIILGGATPDCDTDIAEKGLALVVARPSIFARISPIATDVDAAFTRFTRLLDLAGLPGNHAALAGWLALRVLRPAPADRVSIATLCPITLALTRACGALDVPPASVDAATGTDVAVIAKDGRPDTPAHAVMIGRKNASHDAERTALRTPAGALLIPSANPETVGGSWTDAIAAASNLAATTGRGAYAASPDAARELDWTPVNTHPDVEADSIHEDWKPEIAFHDDLKPHPANLIQSATLASVQPPACTYRPRLTNRIIQSGLISNAQFEFLVAAGNAHSRHLPPSTEEDDQTEARERRVGIYLADGTGAGKTNSMLGAIIDNRLHGRMRAILVLAKRRHLRGFVETWQRFGQRESQLIYHWEHPESSPLPDRSGLLVTTYSQLRKMDRSGTFTEVKRIQTWAGADFDGILAFDEAQEMRNAAGNENMSGKTSETSLQGLAGLYLQNQLPDARVIYASATGATDVHNLAYADRLGLWGSTTAFPQRTDFIGAFEAGGIADLEQVTLSLKAQGLYVSRALSFEGVEIEHLPVTMTPEERRIYNEAADLWKEMHSAIPHMRTLCGLPADSDDSFAKRQSGLISGHIPHSGLNGIFEANRKIAMATLIASFKTRGIIDDIRKRVANGQHVVVQMQNTYEAQLQRALANQDDLSKITLEPAELVEFAMKLPTHKYELVPEIVNGEKKNVYKPVLDANDNHVEVAEAIAHRNRLIARARSMKLPLPPLDQIITTFGTSMVAEVTGRGARLVPDRPGGRDQGAMGIHIEKRSEDQRLEDIEAFHAGRKQILVFSTGAGGASLSYHARTGTAAANRRRVHYLVQLGYRADEVTQGIGRTHRSDQASAPLVTLVSLDLPADRLYASRIVNALFKLGALTQGHRHAASNGMFDERDCMDGAYAAKAWESLQHDITAGLIPGYTWESFMSDMGLNTDGQGTINSWGKQKSIHVLSNVNQLINRVAALGDRKQMLIFDALRAKIDQQVEAAIRDGSFRAGPEVLKATSLAVLGENAIHTDPIFGSETRLLRLRKVTSRNFIEFKDAYRTYLRAKAHGRPWFAKHATTGAVALIVPTRARKTALGDLLAMVEVITPMGSEERYQRIVDREPWRPFSALDETLEQIWAATIAGAQQETISYLTMATGSMLPLWQPLCDASGSHSAIWRLKTDDGRAFAGRPLSVRRAVAMMEALGHPYEVSDLEVSDIEAQLKAGAQVTLATSEPFGAALELDLSASSTTYRITQRTGGDPTLQGFLTGTLYAASGIARNAPWIVTPPAGQERAFLKALLAICPAAYVDADPNLGAKAAAAAAASTATQTANPANTLAATV